MKESSKNYPSIEELSRVSIEFERLGEIARETIDIIIREFEIDDILVVSNSVGVSEAEFGFFLFVGKDNEISLVKSLESKMQNRATALLRELTGSEVVRLGIYIDSKENVDRNFDGNFYSRIRSFD